MLVTASIASPVAPILISAVDQSESLSAIATFHLEATCSCTCSGAMPVSRKPKIYVPAQTYHPKFLKPKTYNTLQAPKPYDTPKTSGESSPIKIGRIGWMTTSHVSRFCGSLRNHSKRRTSGCRSWSEDFGFRASEVGMRALYRLQDLGFWFRV